MHDTVKLPQWLEWQASILLATVQLLHDQLFATFRKLLLRPAPPRIEAATLVLELCKFLITPPSPSVSKYATSERTFLPKPSSALTQMSSSYVMHGSQLKIRISTRFSTQGFPACDPSQRAMRSHVPWKDCAKASFCFSFETSKKAGHEVLVLGGRVEVCRSQNHVRSGVDDVEVSLKD